LGGGKETGEKTSTGVKLSKEKKRSFSVEKGVRKGSLARETRNVVER